MSTFENQEGTIMEEASCGQTLLLLKLKAKAFDRMLAKECPDKATKAACERGTHRYNNNMCFDCWDDWITLCWRAGVEE
jgi:hypothetical protein